MRRCRISWRLRPGICIRDWCSREILAVNDELLLDIERSPYLGYCYGKHKQEIIKFIKYSQLLSISWKWYDEKEVHTLAQCDLPGYVPGEMDDRVLAERLWNLLNKAKKVIAHNGERFDTRVANARFMFHKMPPPSSYSIIDTMKVADRVGLFPSNALVDLGPYFGIGDKLYMGGFEVIEGSMNGDAE